ncbi:MAG TPA: class I SAM-dependent methyltransferase [Kofleriaceae bacterium]|nr:class I SAM-dependent methyltransferase [Kofleriaceae bacterium]
MRPRRYQLTKQATAIIGRGHPWIFRDQLSSAASVFHDGDWLSLVDGQNRVVAHGIYEAEGAIAIRVLRRGPERPDAAWLRGQLAAALARRAPLAARTDGIRLVHGESDGIPAVVVDRFGDTLVATSYSAGADALARYAALALSAPAADASAATGITAAIVRPAHRRLARAAVPAPRAVRGTPPELTRFTEDGLPFSVDLLLGQKTGTYLDLRGLRRAVATAPLAGARVLNLFAYTGMLGRAAEAAGASSIVQVDASERALAFAAAHHVADPARHQFVTADVLAWLPAQPPPSDAGFDLVIVDPPSMTSRKTQVPAVLAAYRKLYRAAARQVRPGGAVVAACCTSRVSRAAFHHVVRESLGADFTLERELPTEPDHPVGFPEADYLKIAWWRRTAAAAAPHSGLPPSPAI